MIHPETALGAVKPVKDRLLELQGSDGLLPSGARLVRAVDRLRDTLALDLHVPLTRGADRLVECCASAELAAAALLAAFPISAPELEMMVVDPADPWAGYPGSFALPSASEWDQFCGVAVGALDSAVVMGQLDVELVHFCCTEIARVTRLALLHRAAQDVDEASLASAVRSAVSELVDAHFDVSTRELLSRRGPAAPSELLCDALTVASQASSQQPLGRSMGGPALEWERPRSRFVDFGTACLRAWGGIAASGYAYGPPASLQAYGQDARELLRLVIASDHVDDHRPQLEAAVARSAEIVLRILPWTWGLARNDANLQQAEHIAVDFGVATRNAIAGIAWARLLDGAQP